MSSRRARGRPASKSIADQFRQPTAVWLTLADEANLAIIAGELDLADQLCHGALEIGAAASRTRGLLRRPADLDRV